MFDIPFPVHRRSLTMTTDTKGAGKYAKVNDINLYYETHGDGPPLILLHGGLGSGETFGPVLTQLAKRHQVTAVDLQGHGRTADIDRRIDVEGLRLLRGGPWSPGADAHRRRRRRHGSAEPLRRGVQVARRRTPRRWLDGRGPAGGRARARDLARSDPLQHRQLATVGCGNPRLPRRATDLRTLARTLLDALYQLPSPPA